MALSTAVPLIIQPSKLPTDEPIQRPNKLASVSQEQLLARIDVLRSTLASTALSVSTCLTLSQSLDLVDTVLPHHPASDSTLDIPSTLNNPSTLNHSTSGDVRNKTHATKPSPIHPDPRQRHHQTVSASRDSPIENVQDQNTVARVMALVDQMRQRQQENKHVQDLALQKALAASHQVAMLEQQVDRMHHDHTDSLSELRLLASRMRRLERRVDGLTAWPAHAISVTSSPRTSSIFSQQGPLPALSASTSVSHLDTSTPAPDEVVARWWRGAKDWWADWGEIGRRMDGRTDASPVKSTSLSPPPREPVGSPHREVLLKASRSRLTPISRQSESTSVF